MALRPPGGCGDRLSPPSKPGRRSHTPHTCWIGSVRLVLDVEVQGGRSTVAKHGLPRLPVLLDRLAPEERPALVRGDNAFGNEGVMAAMDEIDQPCLFKLRQTAGVKRLIGRAALAVRQLAGRRPGLRRRRRQSLLDRLESYATGVLKRLACVLAIAGSQAWRMQTQPTTSPLQPVWRAGDRISGSNPRNASKSATGNGRLNR